MLLFWRVLWCDRERTEEGTSVGRKAGRRACTSHAAVHAFPVAPFTTPRTHQPPQPHPSSRGKKHVSKQVAAPLVGKMRLSIAAYNKESGEIGGVFESVQPSDTDQGSKDPKDVKITGLWYAQITK